MAARSSNPSEFEGDIRRYAKFMARLDACSRARTWSPFVMQRPGRPLVACAHARFPWILRR
eukprot:4508209-Pleurochrysis_carterae.AAC.1